MPERQNKLDGTRDGLSSTVMPPFAVTLTYDILTLKSNQHIYKPEYICDQNLVKFS